MTGRLHDRVAIVTGAGCVGPGWGNGRAIAVRFAEEGAKIFAVDRDLDSVKETIDRVKAAGGDIITHQCDVTGAASVEVMVKPASIASAASTYWSTMSAARLTADRSK